MVSEVCELDLTANFIDSSQVIARLEELEGRIEYDEDGNVASSDLTDDEVTELADLRSLNEDGAECFDDWRYGVDLVHERHWYDYAMETAGEYMDATLAEVDHWDRQRFGGPPLRQTFERWPWNCIDWHQVANDLQADYTAMAIGSATYWGRG